MVKSYGHLKFWCDVTDRAYITTKDANDSKTKTNTVTNLIFSFSERENVGANENVYLGINKTYYIHSLRALS